MLIYMAKGVLQIFLRVLRRGEYSKYAVEPNINRSILIGGRQEGQSQQWRGNVRVKAGVGVMHLKRP